MTITPLSIQDLVPVPSGSSAAQALQRSGALAALGEELGFTRLWYAEHHGLPNIASSSPEVLIAHTAGRTRRLRIGAGGVMLPNHVPLRVAETYRTLEGLYPGRIDLGIGRAGGSDGMTLRALRSFPGENFPEEMAELLAFEARSFPEGHPFSAIQVVPDGVALPPVWLLGSSGASAQMAGQLGLGYAFAAHFSPTPAGPAFEAYRRSFKPSAAFPAPHAILCLSVTCAPTDEEARWLSKSMELTWLRLRRNKPEPIPSPEESAAYPWTEDERAFVAGQAHLWIVGSPETVVEKIAGKLRETGADEVMIATTVHDPEKRLDSYRLLAKEWGLGA